MMPWNPIHRYAGLQSSFDPIATDRAADEVTHRDLSYGEVWNGVTSDPFGHGGYRDIDVSFGHATGVGSAAGAEPPRRPLGFVDVRSEVGEAGDDSANEAELPESEPKAGEDVVGEAHSTESHAEPAADLDEKVPFYKREIGFSRKKASEPMADTTPERESHAADAPIETETVEAGVAQTVAAEPLEAEPVIVASADATHEEPSVTAVEEPAVEDSPPYGETEGVDDSDVAEGLEWPDRIAPAAELPIRELSVDSDADAGAPVVPKPVETPIAAPAAKTPFHKRELSFGKSRGTKTSTNGRGNQRRGGRVVGLKIGASQLAAAVVEEQNGRPELVELARTPLEAGIVVDGEIRDPEALTNALRTFFADHKLPTRDVRIGIASNRIGVRTFEIAGVDDPSRFDNAVRFKAHEVLPIAGSESVLDYRVLDERQAPTGETTRRILLVVAPRDQVAPYAEAAQRAGLKLAGIDLESLGLLRAFVEPQDTSARKATDTATVVVAIGHEASTLMVSGGGVCEFTRVFDWGGSTLQDAITQELEVRPAEAATILRHLSLAGSSIRIEGLDDDARNKAVEAVRLRLTPFARELVSSLQFYQTQPNSLGIGEIVITGGVSQLDGLADALHQMIGVAVRVGDPLQRVAVRKGVETGFEHVIGSLSVAIGLGIDDGAIRSVDLTPGDLAKVASRKLRLVPVLLPIAAVIPLAAVGFMFFQAHGKVSDRTSQLAALDAEFARLPQPKRPQIDATVQGLQAQRASAVAQVLGARPAWDKMLADFARVLPANVWLTELSAQTSRPLSTPIVAAAAATSTGATSKPTTTPAAPATPVSPTGVTITGYTYAQPDVAKLLARLAALPSLQNVQLQASQVATVGKRDVVQFTILADLRETGGAS